MSKVYIIGAQWSYKALSLAGKLTRILNTGDDYGHLGIVFDDLKPAEQALLWQKRERVWRQDETFLPNQTRVTWDVIVSTWTPRFQPHPGAYYKDTLPHKHGMWELALGPGERALLFHQCIFLCEHAPPQSMLVRCDSFWACLPFACCYLPSCVGNDHVGPSTCVTLVLRAIAMITDGDADEDDAAAFRALRFRAKCFGESLLTHFTPRTALNALDAAGWICLCRRIDLNASPARRPLLLTLAR